MVAMSAISCMFILSFFHLPSCKIVFLIIIKLIQYSVLQQGRCFLLLLISRWLQSGLKGLYKEGINLLFSIRVISCLKLTWELIKQTISKWMNHHFAVIWALMRYINEVMFENTYWWACENLDKNKIVFIISLIKKVYKLVWLYNRQLGKEKQCIL